MRVEKWISFATLALTWIMSYLGTVQTQKLVSSIRNILWPKSSVFLIILQKLLICKGLHTDSDIHFCTDKLLTHAETVYGWSTVILCNMRKLCQYPTCIHTLCSFPKAQYSTTSLIQNTITYSSKHVTFPAFKHRVFCTPNIVNWIYSHNLQFKAILQASHYNCNSKYYIFLKIHKTTLTLDYCVSSLPNSNIQLLARNAHRETRTRLWPSLKPKFSCTCMCTVFVLNGI